MNWEQFKGFTQECIRVLRVTKKPDKFEFKTVVKVTGLGMIIIGTIGFLIHLMNSLLLS